MKTPRILILASLLLVLGLASWQTVHAQLILEPQQQLLGHDGWVNAVAWRPDSNQLASVGQDGSVRIWDASNGATLHLLQGHTGSVVSAAWRADGMLLATGGLDNTIILWDTDTEQRIATYSAAGSDIWGLDWVQDRVASVGSDTQLRIWQGDTLIAEALAHAAPAYALVSNGDRVATTGYDGMIALWDADGNLLGTLDNTAYFSQINNIAWFGDTLAVVGESAEVILWDTASNAVLAQIATPASSLYGVAFSDEGQWLAVGGGAGTITLIDVASRQVITSQTAHSSLVAGLDFQGDWLASGGYDGVVTVWRISG